MFLATKRRSCRFQDRKHGKRKTHSSIEFPLPIFVGVFPEKLFGARAFSPKNSFNPFPPRSYSPLLLGENRGPKNVWKKEGKRRVGCSGGGGGGGGQLHFQKKQNVSAVCPVSARGMGWPKILFPIFFFRIEPQTFPMVVFLSNYFRSPCVHFPPPPPPPPLFPSICERE